MDDRISKASCYGISLTFFFETSRRDSVAAASTKKGFQNVSGKIAEKLLPSRHYFRLDICRSSRNNPSVFSSTTQKGSAMPSPPSDELLVEFQGRMSFLETMWGCKTAYDVDIETGRGWLEVRMPGTGAVLRINKLNVKDVMVPGEGGAQPLAT
jgi:hypothetical protein